MLSNQSECLQDESPVYDELENSTKEIHIKEYVMLDRDYKGPLKILSIGKVF
jgi:hypothetical protein